MTEKSSEPAPTPALPTREQIDAKLSWFGFGPGSRAKILAVFEPLIAAASRVPEASTEAGTRTDAVRDEDWTHGGVAGFPMGEALRLARSAGDARSRVPPERPAPLEADDFNILSVAELSARRAGAAKEADALMRLRDKLEALAARVPSGGAPK